MEYTSGVENIFLTWKPSQYLSLLQVTLSQRPKLRTINYLTCYPSRVLNSISWTLTIIWRIMWKSMVHLSHTYRQALDTVHQLSHPSDRATKKERIAKILLAGSTQGCSLLREAMRTT